jgi:hypothetical protein
MLRRYLRADVSLAVLPPAFVAQVKCAGGKTASSTSCHAKGTFF